MKQGKLIVIEGSDGSGKKTQTDCLIKRLESEGHEVAYYDFPQYYTSFFGKMVGRYLDGEFGEADDVNPYLNSILYAGDRFEASKKMWEDLKAGKVLILNRYTQSNIAFQTAKLSDLGEKEQFRQWVMQMEFEVFGIPRADLVLFLYVPYSFGRELVAKKMGREYTTKVHDIHERNEDFMQRAEREYLYLAKTYPEWRKIDCTQDGQLLSIEAIAERVWKVMEREL